MTAKKASKIGTEATNVKISVRVQVLHEAGFKCANPCCRYPITLDLHHLHYVSEGGSDDAANLWLIRLKRTWSDGARKSSA